MTYELDEQPHEPSSHRAYDIAKRLFDVVLASLEVVLLSPVLLAISVAIAIDSRGPVLYAQKRIGRWGVPFSCLRFRTLFAEQHPAAEASLLAESSAAIIRPANDPRVTRVGKFLRRTALDQLPKFLNILRGEMSLVGPRALLAFEVTMYDRWPKQRFEVRPGMTGISQVKSTARSSYEELAGLDMWYVEHRSFWLDLRILVQTALAVFHRRDSI